MEWDHNSNLKKLHFSEKLHLNLNVVDGINTSPLSKFINLPRFSFSNSRSSLKYLSSTTEGRFQESTDYLMRSCVIKYSWRYISREWQGDFLSLLDAHSVSILAFDIEKHLCLSSKLLSSKSTDSLIAIRLVHHHWLSTNII